MKRRRFLKLSSQTAITIPFINLLNSSHTPFVDDSLLPAADDVVYSLFEHPENIHKPFVRWWWNGDRVTKHEVLRELDVMKDAGIGGVEINPIKWNENADPIGIGELKWGSSEWLDVVEAAVKGAKEKGIVCDMIIGSGWPFGGEFVPIKEQSQIIILGTKNLSGSQQYTFSRQELENSVTPPSAYTKMVRELFLLRIAPAEMNSFTPGIDLNSQVKNDSIRFDLPAGDHVLYYLVKITGFQSVLQGALGANGPVINHYDQTAVENYLNHFADILSGRLGDLSNYFRAFFTDSIELEGANWCNDMFEQFKLRKGYDLEPYFPYILFKVGEMGNLVKEEYGSKFSPELRSTLDRIHYDFEETRISLFQSRFIGTFTNWCRKQKVKSRMQAYGMDCHPLDSSMLIDIPECETWIWVPQVDDFEDNLTEFHGRNYTMINKFVSSAAHLSGKQLISCEEMTNTGHIFMTTLERVKVTGDQSNLSGVTHSVLHGFNYSPVEVSFPGWLRYGSFFNERNPWWPYFKLWSAYKSRISALFQNSVMQADIAVLHPLADLASKYGFQRDPFPNISYPPYVHQVWEAIHQNGNGCDYTSEHIIQQSIKSKGRLNYNTRSYQALILIEVETLEPATSHAIRQFADAGGKVIFIGKTPHLSSGLEGFQKKSKSIAADSQAILKHTKTTGIVDAPSHDLLAWFQKIQTQFSLKPYVQFSNPVYHVSQLYYKTATKDIFYFINYSAAKSHSFKASFADTKTAFIWDAETGKRFKFPPDENKEFQVTLGPSETKIMVFENLTDVEEENYAPVNIDKLTASPIPGPWEISLQHMNGTAKVFLRDQPVDLRTMPNNKDFSGTITYRTVLKIDHATTAHFLSLGHINDISELEINGRPLGTRWYGNHIYDISKAIQNGDNYITIKVVTTAAAYTKSLTSNKAAQEWSGGELFSPIGLDSPVMLYN